MSTVVFRHEYNNAYKTKNGDKVSVKEYMLDGERGISFSFLKKEGEKAFYRVSVKENSPDNFSVKEKKNDKESESTMTLSELQKLLKNDDLKFVTNYMKERSKYNPKLKGGKKRSRKSSKKSSKSSKKSSKKRSYNAVSLTEHVFDLAGGKKRSRKSSKKSKKSSKKSMKGVENIFEMAGGKKRSRKSKKSSRKSSKKRSMKGLFTPYPTL